MVGDSQKAIRQSICWQHWPQVIFAPFQFSLRQDPSFDVCTNVRWPSNLPPFHSNPMLAGNVVALLSPLIFIPLLTYAFGPQNYDYKSMAQIRLADDIDLVSSDPELTPSSQPSPSRSTSLVAGEQEKLARASIIAKSLTGFMTLALLILWPIPLYGTGYIFSKRFFTGWVVVGILWLFFSAFCVGLYPLWEGRKSMAHTFKGILKDLSRGGGGVKVRGRTGVVIESENKVDFPEKESMP